MRAKYDLLLVGLYQLNDIGEHIEKLMCRSSIVLVETTRYLITFTDKEKIKATEKVTEMCQGLGWKLEKDVSEPPKLPIGHLSNEMYWLDNEDRLDAYLVWKVIIDKHKEAIDTESAFKEKE